MDREAREENSSSPNGSFIVEKLEYIGASGDSCRVTITGGSFFYLFSELIQEWDIFRSKILTNELAESFLSAHEECLAYWKALDIIAGRDQSAEMLTLKLKKRGFSEEACSRVLGRLQEKGLVDDERFAWRYTDSVLRKKHEGRRKLYARLLNKGIHRETAERTVSLISKEEETAALVTAGEKLLRRKTHIPEEKLVRALLAKGFQYGDIRRFLAEKISHEN
jgi:regulatory protein